MVLLIPVRCMMNKTESSETHKEKQYCVSKRIKIGTTHGNAQAYSTTVSLCQNQLGYIGDSSRDQFQERPVFAVFPMFEHRDTFLVFNFTF